MIDINKLPAPQIVEELDYETILTAMRVKLAELLPDWTASDLESDPANKVLEVAAYREMLLRQRINEAVRACMIAYSTGTNLDNIVANGGVSRLPGAQATFPATFVLSAVLDLPVTVPAGFTVVSSNNEYQAQLMADVTIAAGETTTDGRFELITPVGNNGNALSLTWQAITPLPFVVDIIQTATSTGGSDVESDEALRMRAPLAMERYSVAGPYDAYRYWALTADERIEDVKVVDTAPGCILISLMSSDNDGVADEAMINRVNAILSAEDIRPLDDFLTIQSAEAIDYTIQAHIELYPGVATSEAYTAAVAGLTAKAASLRKIGKDVVRTALLAAAHVEGVKSVTLTSPETDIIVTERQFARCAHVEVTNNVAEAE